MTDREILLDPEIMGLAHELAAAPLEERTPFIADMTRLLDAIAAGGTRKQAAKDWMAACRAAWALGQDTPPMPDFEAIE